MNLNAFVVVVDDLFSVIHAAVTDLDCVAIKDFSKFGLSGSACLLGQGICVRYWC